MFANNEGQFRATRDLDMVLIVEALTPEYLILFKAKAYLDLSDRKHKNDILRIAVEFVLESVTTLSTTVIKDMEQFIIRLEAEPFDAGVLTVGIIRLREIN